MKSLTAKLVLCLTSVIGISLLAQMQSSNTGSSEEISEIVQSLPKCSHFRLELERGARGTGVEQHYMELMRKQRTKRATIHVTCALIRGRASGPFLVTRRLYFRE